MRCVAITACALLLLVASANASTSGADASCTGGQLRMAVQAQGENTTAWIGVVIQNRQSRCGLAGVMTFTLVSGQRLLRVAGNPLRVRVTGSLAARGSHSVRADWSNWCGRRSGRALLVEYAGETMRLAFADTPVCLNSTWPSKLVSIR